MRRTSSGVEHSSRDAKRANVVAAAMAAAILAMATGCQVDEHKTGDSENVKIQTPFGGMQVKTNDSVVMDGIGLPVYPGSVAVKKDNDNGAADVNMSFGSFQLRVKAMSFRTGDSQDKVETFYLKSLRRFGDVIACRDNSAVGTPTRTAEGLTCDNDKENHITAGDSVSHGKLELKAGSKQHQHLVEIDPDGGGTKFGVVALDLPGKAFSGEKDDQ
jgi:hypothetical protein